MTISNTQSDFLNLARWLAALVVVAEHARSLMFQDFGTTGGSGVFGKAFYFLTGFGHEAVMVFFVISGYLVGGKVWSRMQSGGFRWLPYLCDRVSRLHAVLLFALLLGLILDTAGSRFFDSFGLYRMAMPEPVAVVSRSFVDDLGLPVLLGNLGLVQTILVPTYGSNGPLWSLANEWWYYLLFPSLLGIFLRRGATRWAAAASVGAMVWFLPASMWVLFVVWLLGVATAVCRRRLLPWWVAVPLCLGALVIARLEVLPLAYGDRFAVGIGFALLLNSLSGHTLRLPWQRLSAWLADFSYTTYLVHFPLLMFGLSLCHQLGGNTLRQPFSLSHVAGFAAAVMSVMVISWGISLVTEARTSQFRSLLYRWTGQSKRPSAGQSASI
jgi:peptidoglycan/LPS O-acetylase OafA/YrhL